MNNTLDPARARDVRGAAALMARRISKPMLVDPYEYAWVKGKIDDDAYCALADDADDPTRHSFKDRRILAVLIAERSLANPEGRPNDLDFGLILATVNGTQSLEDLREQFAATK